ncbi:MAG: hypothetical protein ACLPSH_11510 [Vulcanimicrobiaceae bacterium]|jgi:hypothetical protein
MTNATMPQAVTMRLVKTADDVLAAATILTLAMEDDLDAFKALVPNGATTKAVELAEDETAAVFAVYAGNGWDATDAAPIHRIIVRR